MDISEKYIYIPCEECAGEGKGMRMVCYGGTPYEQYYDCECCHGEGEIEILEADYIIATLKG